MHFCAMVKLFNRPRHRIEPSNSKRRYTKIEYSKQCLKYICKLDFSDKSCDDSSLSFSDCPGDSSTYSFYSFLKSVSNTFTRSIKPNLLKNDLIFYVLGNFTV